MKKSQIFVFLLCLGMGIFASCGGNQKPQIPNTANVVVSIDLQKILGKATDIKKILKDKKFLENFPESQTFADILPLLIDGNFDKTQRIHFYTNADTRKPENSFLGMHLILKDEKKWAENAEKAFKEKTKKINKFTTIYKKPFLLAWRNNILWGAFGDKSENELAKLITEWSNVSEKESFTAKNSAFAETQKNTHDIQFWSNTQNATDMLSMYFLPEDVKNQAKDDVTGLNVAVNFENGAINAEVFTYFLKGKSERYTRLIRTNLDKSVLNDNPVANPKLFLGLAFNMNGIAVEIQKQKNFKKEAQNFKKDTGVELLQVMQNLTGDFAGAIENIDYSRGLLGLRFTLSANAKIKDRKIFDDMMRNERTSEMFKKVEDNLYEGTKDSEGQYIYIEKDMVHFIIGKDLLKKIKEEKGELGKNTTITTVVNNQNTTILFDLQQLLKGTKEISASFEPLEQSLKTFAITTGGIQKEKDIWVGRFSLMFQDTKNNAIPLLYDLYLKTQEATKKAEKEEEEKRKKRKEMEKDNKGSDDDFEKFLKEGEKSLEKPTEEL